MVACYTRWKRIYYTYGLMILLSLNIYAANRYVSLTGGNVAPYTTWATAGTNLSTVFSASTEGDTIILSNGIHVVSATIVINKNITFEGKTGNPQDVLISGNGSVRLFDLSQYNKTAIFKHLTLTRSYSTDHGGAIKTGLGATLIVTNCWFTRNAIGASVRTGGALFMSPSSAIYNSYFISNSVAANSDGGAIYMPGGLVKSCVFVTNIAYRYGAAIRMDGGIVRDSVFLHNQAFLTGYGTVCMYAGSPVVSNCYFAYNQASNNTGAIYVGSGTVLGCTVVSNVHKSTSVRGAIWMESGLVDKLIVAYNRNDGLYDGGGVYVANGILRNSLIYGNYTTRYAGGVRVDNGVVENCTIVGNQAGSQGGGIMNYLRGTVRNCIIVSNTAPTQPNYTTAYTGAYHYCISVPALPPSYGNGNITGDPLFITNGVGYGINHIPGNYHLRSNSPCRDSGTNQLWMITGVDLDKKKRIRKYRVDMGAYEFDSPVTVFVTAGKFLPQGGNLLIKE